MDFGNLFQEISGADEIDSFLQRSDIYTDIGPLETESPKPDDEFVQPSYLSAQDNEREKERQTQIQDLQTRISEKSRQLELNQKLQARILEQLDAVQSILTKWGQKPTKSVKFGQSGPSGPSMKSGQSGQNTSSSQYQDEDFVISEPSEPSDLSGVQFLQSFPLHKGLPYFTQSPGKDPRLKTAEGIFLVRKVPKKAIVIKNWTKRSEELLQHMVMDLCRGLIAHGVVDEDQKEVLDQYNKASTADEKTFHLQRMIPGLLRRFSWDAIAKAIGHSQADCFSHWMNHCDPLINHQSWTLEEDMHLFEIATRTHGRQWVDVAMQLGTSRVPIQCLQRYLRHLELDYNFHAWSAEEDTILLEKVREHGKKAWHKVAKSLPGRTGSQCRSRYFQALVQHQGKKGRWSRWEACRLLLYLYFYGENWSVVSKKMMSRNTAQCRDHWFRYLHPSICHDRWKGTEDKLLLSLVNKKGITSWTTVATHFSGRTADMCKTRYNLIKSRK